jgi:hypothetical protein
VAETQPAADGQHHQPAVELPVELHLYALGGHGFGMRRQNLPSDSRIDRFGDWLQVSGFMQSN